MTEWLTSYGFWFVLGLVLLILEWLLPGVMVLFFGLGALLVGGLTWLGIVATLPWQLGWFALLSVASLLLLRKRFQRWMRGTVTDPGDGRGSGETLRGRRVQVLESFAQGCGIVELNGARWDAESDEDLVAGQSAWVVANRGIVLQVVSAPPEE